MPAKTEQTGATFALYSSSGETIHLAFFQPGASDPYEEHEMERDGNVWSITATAPEGAEYAYRIGSRYVLDPYAKYLSENRAERCGCQGIAI